MTFDPVSFYSFITAPDFVSVKFLGLHWYDRKLHNAYFGRPGPFYRWSWLSRPSKTGRRKQLQRTIWPSMNVQIKYVMPFFIFLSAWKLSSGIALYWTTMNIFAIVHETIVRRKAEKIYGEPNKNNISSSGGTAWKNDRCRSSWMLGNGRRTGFHHQNKRSRHIDRRRRKTPDRLKSYCEKNGWKQAQKDNLEDLPFLLDVNDYQMKRIEELRNIARMRRSQRVIFFKKSWKWSRWRLMTGELSILFLGDTRISKRKASEKVLTEGWL